MSTIKNLYSFYGFSIRTFKNMVENSEIGQTSNLYLYRSADLVFDENGKIIKDRFPPNIL